MIVLAIIFYFADVPDIKTEDDYHLDDAAPGASHSIWSHPHFVMAVAAQFFYVAAQAGIFSFFINYMTSEVPPIPGSWQTALGSVSAHASFLHKLAFRLVRDRRERRPRSQQQGRVEPGVHRVRVFPRRAFQRRRPAEEIRRRTRFWGSTAH